MYTGCQCAAFYPKGPSNRRVAFALPVLFRFRYRKLIGRSNFPVSPVSPVSRRLEFIRTQEARWKRETKRRYGTLQRIARPNVPPHFHPARFANLDSFQTDDRSLTVFLRGTQTCCSAKRRYLGFCKKNRKFPISHVIIVRYIDNCFASGARISAARNNSTSLTRGKTFLEIAAAEVFKNI